MERVGKDGIVVKYTEVGRTKLEIDTEQAEKAKHMFDAMTKTVSEYHATVDFPKPTKPDS